MKRGRNAGSANNPIFKTLWLNGFIDIPLRFLFTLKTIYNRAGDYTNKNGEKLFRGNHQTLGKESLDHHLGGLALRIQKHLESRHATSKADAAKVNEITRLLLETTFAIAKARRWLLTDPVYEDDVYKFNLNAGYFDTQAIAKHLQHKTRYM